MSLFLCQQDYEKKAGLICMKFSGKVWSDHGTTSLHFWSIPRNRATPRRATRGRGLLCFSTTACYHVLCIIVYSIIHYYVEDNYSRERGADNTVTSWEFPIFLVPSNVRTGRPCDVTAELHLSARRHVWRSRRHNGARGRCSSNNTPLFTHTSKTV